MDEKVVTQLLKEYLFLQPETNLFAVLDGASVPELPQILWEHEPKHVCLYRGELEPDMAEVAPYLAWLDGESPFAEWVLKEGWGKHWGIFATAPAEADFLTLRQHFRKFLMVVGPEGESLYFRYYDPRVLRVYLPTCNAEEIRTVFGPIRSYVLEGDDPSVLLRFSPGGEKVKVEKVTMGQD